MSGWGATAGDEKKPGYLTDDQKETTFGTNKGWEYLDPNTGRREVLVAINNLAHKLGDNCQVDTVYFIDREFANDDVQLVVNWNTPVNVTAGATVVLSNTANSLSYTLTFDGYLPADQINTNQTVFSFTPVDGAHEDTLTWSLAATLTGTFKLALSPFTSHTNRSLTAGGDDGATDVRVTLVDTISRA